MSIEQDYKEELSTLHKCIYELQERFDKLLFEYRQVCQHPNVKHEKQYHSGGQTGVDLAGGYAGYHLDIDTTMLLPKGFKQRHEDGVDIDHTREKIMKQITGEK